MMTEAPSPDRAIAACSRFLQALAITCLPVLCVAQTETSSQVFISTLCKGMATTDAGTPVAGVAARAYNLQFNEAGGLDRFVLLGESTTAVDGSFRLQTRVPAERASAANAVVVIHTENAAVGWAHLPLEGVRQVSVQLGTPATLSGRVVDQGKQPVVGADVRAVLFANEKGVWLPGLPPLEFLASRSGGDGSFEIGSIPRHVKVDLLVTAPGMAQVCTRSPGAASGHAGATYPPEAQNIVVSMAPEGGITGRVVSASTRRGLQGITFAVVPCSTGLFFARRVVRSGGDGSFAIGGLSGDRYLLRGTGAFPSEYVLVEPGNTTRDVVVRLPDQ